MLTQASAGIQSHNQWREGIAKIWDVSSSSLREVAAKSELATPTIRTRSENPIRYCPTEIDLPKTVPSTAWPRSARRKNKRATQIDADTNEEQMPTASRWVFDKRLAKAIAIPDPTAQAIDCTIP